MLKKVTSYDNEILIGRVGSYEETEKGNLILSLRTNYEDTREGVAPTYVKVIVTNAGVNNAERMRNLASKLHRGLTGAVMVLGVQTRESESGKTMRAANWWSVVGLPSLKSN